MSKLEGIAYSIHLWNRDPQFRFLYFGQHAKLHHAKSESLSYCRFCISHYQMQKPFFRIPTYLPARSLMRLCSCASSSFSVLKGIWRQVRGFSNCTRSSCPCARAMSSAASRASSKVRKVPVRSQLIVNGHFDSQPG